jgi:ribose 5-phosphate isomerase B
MRIGIASNHGGFALKCQIAAALRASGREVRDFGDDVLDPSDDYPDFVALLARAVAAGKVERGVAICGSDVGASIAANKIPGVRAGLIHDVFSARQEVEDDDMNVLCMGGRVIGAKACTAAPRVKRAPAISTVRLRPIRSAISPAASAPSKAPRVTQDVTTSTMSGLSVKVFLMPRNAPEMTPWS